MSQNQNWWATRDTHYVCAALYAAQSGHTIILCTGHLPWIPCRRWLFPESSTEWPSLWSPVKWRPSSARWIRWSSSLGWEQSVGMFAAIELKWLLLIQLCVDTAQTKFLFLFISNIVEYSIYFQMQLLLLSILLKCNIGFWKYFYARKVSKVTCTTRVLF